jgi:hypothetical protein
MIPPKFPIIPKHETPKSNCRASAGGKSTPEFTTGRQAGAAGALRVVVGRVVAGWVEENEARVVARAPVVFSPFNSGVLVSERVDDSRIQA